MRHRRMMPLVSPCKKRFFHRTTWWITFPVMLISQSICSVCFGLSVDLDITSNGVFLILCRFSSLLKFLWNNGGIFMVGIFFIAAASRWVIVSRNSGRWKVGNLWMKSWKFFICIFVRLDVVSSGYSIQLLTLMN